MDAHRRVLLQVEVKSNGACPNLFIERQWLLNWGACTGGASGAELHRHVSTTHIDRCGRAEHICIDMFQLHARRVERNCNPFHVSQTRGVVVQWYIGAWMHLHTPPAMGHDGTGWARVALTLVSARRPAFSASHAAIGSAWRRSVSPRPAFPVPSRLGYPNIAFVHGRGESLALNSCDSCLTHPSVTAQHHR